MQGSEGKRTALLIATDTYADRTFQKLRAPQSDAVALAGVLGDVLIGGYEVMKLHNEPSHVVQRAIEDVLVTARLDDLVLIYISGHGVKDDSGRLYFATTNSQHDRLGSTTVSAMFVRDQMENSRCRRLMLWLDCCYAGAFPPGMRHRARHSIDVLERLGGRGCAVMTSSNALEYSFETGDGSTCDVSGVAPQGPSVFTGSVVEGLRTGNADLDEDGLIDIKELYEYVHQSVRAKTSKQTPTLDSKIEGKLYVASSVRPPRESPPSQFGENVELKSRSRRRRTVRVVACAIMLCMTSAGLGIVDYPDGQAVSGNDRPSACDISKGELIIGVISPLSGSEPLPMLARGIKNSVQLAVDQANEQCKVPGYRLSLRVEDDKGTPEIGKEAAVRLSSDPNLAGVIGTLQSSVAYSVVPVLASANVVMISPANTWPGITRGENYNTDPERPYSNYFRVSSTDDVQGAYAADYLVGLEGKQRIAVITDGGLYGETLAEGFIARAERAGGSIVANEMIRPDQTNFSTVLGGIKNLAADAVYFGGQYPAGSLLSAQMADMGLNVPLMGGDGICEDEFTMQGGRLGDLATDDGAPAQYLASGRIFLEAYGKKNYDAEPGVYGAFAYDAANAIIGALIQTVDRHGWSTAKRSDLLRNVGSYEGNGATGSVKFDQYGDTVSRLISIWKVTDKGWQVLKTGVAFK